MSRDTTELGDEADALYRYAVTLTRNRIEADDLVQDCMERALRKWKLRRGSVPLRPWLFRMMRNLHVSRWRRMRRHQGHAQLDEFSAQPPVAGNQEDRVELNRLLTRLMDLPSEQREALVLVTIEGLSYADTARTLGVAEGTVMSRISRARASLRDTSAPSERAILRRVK